MKYEQFIESKAITTTARRWTEGSAKIMREILFRAKKSETKEWVEGSYCYSCISLLDIFDIPSIRVVSDDEFVNFAVIPETVGQYTGLTDKEGQKIFEGDIIEIVDTFNEIIRGVVYWCNGAFWADCTPPDGDESFYGIGYLPIDCVEIIGNIYDNPELLNKEEKHNA